MLPSALVVLSFLVYTHASPYPLQDDAVVYADEDAYLSVPELLTKYGYPAEEHFVTTPDGYILRLHRIAHGRNGETNNKVAFLMHGLLCSSVDWIILGPEKALGYILADEGYDVWMGNARGNHESRNHTVLDPDRDGQFWQFSWHEIGFYDVPAMIDYVLATTGKEKLYHVGHSQGTTSFYVMTSTRPEYGDKIEAHFSLAPVGYMNHMTSPLMKIMAFWSGPLDLLLGLIGINEFLPSNDFLAMIGDVFCNDNAITQFLCSNALFVICGFSPGEMNATMLPVLTGHTPAGASVRQMMHYAQEINSGTFRQYDFGLDNIKIYGSLTPPKYKVSHITAPIYMFYSHNDWMAAESDVLKLCKEIGDNCRGKFLISDDNFNHLDYLYGIRANELVYNRLVSLMAKS